MILGLIINAWTYKTVNPHITDITNIYNNTEPCFLWLLSSDHLSGLCFRHSGFSLDWNSVCRLMNFPPVPPCCCMWCKVSYSASMQNISGPTCTVNFSDFYCKGWIKLQGCVGFKGISFGDALIVLITTSQSWRSR